MKNNKGFTLIEILAVITIILILIIVIAPIIDKNIEDTEDFYSETQVKLFEDAAYTYAIDYEAEIPLLDSTGVATVTLQALLDKGLLEEKKLKSKGEYMMPLTNIVIIVNMEESIITKYDAKQENKPLIILNGPSKLTMNKNNTYNELGAYVVTLAPNSIAELSASDIQSGVNNSQKGTYQVEYNYTGANTVIRTVYVNDTEIDNINPVITLLGSANISISKGTIYNDAGATASDNKDGNITARIIKTGTVNINQKGKYYIKYDVTDLSGNKATTIIRTVIIN